MTTAMRILVLGAGGTGGYFGGRLAQAGADVTFLVRPARAARLREHGLVIRSPHGDAQLPVQTITADQAATWGRADLVLLSCKAYDLEDAITAIRPVVGERTVVLPVLNGLAHLERLDAAFGESRVLGGLCHISATSAPDGAVLHLSNGQGPAVHSITFGERTPHAPRERTEAIRDVFATANFDSVLAENVMQDMWEKFTFLTSLAAMTCLMRATVGEIVATDEGAALNEAMFTACERVAAASGYPNRQAARERGLNVLTQAGSPLTASMLRDLESGARVEADHIVGDMLRRGRALGTDVSLLRVAFAHLQAYQQRLLRPAVG
ncbi:2-dehydropantoate 2-reductase [Ralstonia holmesii]|uniref:2-dehydropantoate 2-reductase n=2 Tax=Burkholderiaceae TaxID=119060 RepID=A0ABC8QCR6_9RALS|nr:2-dehydropantoate 2-reductase [Ralstonia sp. LMG 32967]CAJ0791726.1 2-dehydropantoate 2-reductase [Ralstonia sp. LMG 32967]CAJ0816561.1 2-dehydropantoate 2-reductase [Ralstonia sp. LMG 32967]